MLTHLTKLLSSGCISGAQTLISIVTSDHSMEISGGLLTKANKHNITILLGDDLNKSPFVLEKFLLILMIIYICVKNCCTGTVLCLEETGGLIMKRRGNTIEKKINSSSLVWDVQKPTLLIIILLMFLSILEKVTSNIIVSRVILNAA